MRSDPSDTSLLARAAPRVASLNSVHVDKAQWKKKMKMKIKKNTKQNTS